MPHQCVLWKCQCWQSVIEFILANWSNRNHLHPQLWRRCQNLRRWREYQWKRWFCCCCCGNRMWRRSKKLFVPGREVYTYVGFEDKITVSSGPTKKEPRREAHSLVSYHFTPGLQSCFDFSFKSRSSKSLRRIFKNPASFVRFIQCKWKRRKFVTSPRPCKMIHG